MKQSEVFSLILDEVKRISASKTKPVRIAINGIEGTGKTTFAANFVTYLKIQNITAFHVSIDGFHFNKDIRYRQGRDSAKGYYEDSYDEAAFVNNVLRSSQEEEPTYIEATHDLKTDEYLDLPPQNIPNNAVIITDGCYLFKPIFNSYWDLRIYLKTNFNTALERAAQRDKNSLGGYEAAKKMFKTRYHIASRRYLEEVNPMKLADLIFDMSDFNVLKLITKR